MKKRGLAAIVVAAVVFASCSKEDSKSSEILIEKTAATLHYGEEFQIKATSDYDLTYESEDKYHAVVDDKGLVTATYVGETNIVIKNSETEKKVKITVTPQYELYNDPSGYFGMSKEQILSKFGEPAAQTAKGAISYKDYSSYAPLIMFTIENDKVANVALLIEVSNMSKMINSLKERYFYIGMKNDIYTFANSFEESKMTMGVTMSVYSAQYLMVVYVPYNN